MAWEPVIGKQSSKHGTTAKDRHYDYARELSWLFYQLKSIFSERIDYLSKYDFYGMLAQSAIDQITKGDKPQDDKALLLAVLNKAKGFCEDEPPA